MNDEDVIRRIFDAIEKVTGISCAVIASRSQIREHVFARMIAVHHLRTGKIEMLKICAAVGVYSSRGISRLIRAYRTERTPYFQNCANKVNEILSGYEKYD